MDRVGRAAGHRDDGGDLDLGERLTLRQVSRADPTAGPDETYKALVDGRGICLVAAGNAPSIARGGGVTVRVDGLPSCRLALARRRYDDHPHVAA